MRKNYILTVYFANGNPHIKDFYNYKNINDYITHKILPEVKIFHLEITNITITDYSSHKTFNWTDIYKFCDENSNTLSGELRNFWSQLGTN